MITGTPTRGTGWAGDGMGRVERCTVAGPWTALGEMCLKVALRTMSSE